MLNQQIINKYISDEFGEISNPPSEKEMEEFINNNNKLTLEGVKLWALFGGDLMIKGYNGNTILHIASFVDQLDIIQYVLDKGVDVDYLNSNKITALMLASKNGHINVINLLLDSGANINHQDNDGWSVLHWACDWNKLETVKLLIDKGVDIHLIGNYHNKNETALDVAKYKNHQQIIDYLIPFYNK